MLNEPMEHEEASMAAVCRSPAAIKKHYDIEKELAAILRNAPVSDRVVLYASLYDELFRRVPDHPQLTRKRSPWAISRDVCRVMPLLRRFVRPSMSFLEIGAGDCSLSFSVARIAARVFAVDVSAEVTRCSSIPTNATVMLSDGTSIPLPNASVDLAFSDQLMEHLHPDDAYSQLKNVYDVLADGGKYVCITPNRITGPHDVSRYFDEVATGFHLREYTIAECATLFRAVGFSRVTFYVGGRGLYLRFPVALAIACERLASILPSKVRKSRPIKGMLGMIVVGHK